MKKVHMVLFATLLFTGFSSVSAAHAMYAYSQYGYVGGASLYNPFGNTWVQPAYQNFSPTKESWCESVAGQGYRGTIGGVSCDDIIGRISTYPSQIAPIAAPVVAPVISQTITQPSGTYAYPITRAESSYPEASTYTYTFPGYSYSNYRYAY